MTIGRIPSVEGGIQPTIVDAKGDLIAGVAADSINRLAVGSNDQVLVADSSTSTGLAWKSYGAQFVAGKNAVINGGMDIWQRGTSAASVGGNTYSPADRWAIGMGTTGRTISRQTSSLTGFQYALRIQRDSGNTAVTFSYLSQSLESIESYKFAGKTITFSFYARAGANFSASNSQLNLVLQSGTSTDQNILNTWTGGITAISGTPTLTTSWQRFSYTGTVSSAATQLGFYIYNGWSGTAGANDWWEITGVQLELGSVATEFSRAAGTLQGELAACQRYYIRYNSEFTYSRFAEGAFENTTRVNALISFPVRMRVVPTSIESLNIATWDYGTVRAATAVLLDSNSNRDMAVLNVDVASGGNQYRPAQILSNNTTNSYIGFSAEL